VPAPPVVTVIATGRRVRAAWVNELGGVAFALADGAEYVRVYPDENRCSRHRDRTEAAA
jgi:methylmalonyl-CoA mutase N-terminal domain/subunit